MSGAVSLLLLYVFMEWPGTFTFTYVNFLAFTAYTVELIAFWILTFEKFLGVCLQTLTVSKLRRRSRGLHVF
jgi:hypothetical protein